MVNAPRRKGTAAEAMVVRYLQGTYWPYAERRALSGVLDKGDVTGTPGLAWEVKAAKVLSVPAWLRETEVERKNAGADYGTLVIKPEGKGAVQVGSFYALMDRDQFASLATVIAETSSPAVEFETTIRKNHFDQAISLAKLRVMANPRRSSWWYVLYPKFVLTDLGQMASFLNLAGYGTQPVPEAAL